MVSATPPVCVLSVPREGRRDWGVDRKTEAAPKSYTRGAQRRRETVRNNNDKAEKTINRDIHTKTAKERRGFSPPRPCSLWSVLVRCWPIVNPVNHQALPSITSLSFLLLIYFSIDRHLSVARVTFAHWY